MDKHSRINTSELLREKVGQLAQIHAGGERDPSATRATQPLTGGGGGGGAFPAAPAQPAAG